MATKKTTTAWSGMLSFGLITFPVRLYTGAREEKISFNQICPEHKCRIKMPLTCPGGADEAAHQPDRSTLLKGYEYDKNQFVYVTKEELDAIEPEASRTMEIIQFVKADEIDAIYFERSYLLTPDEGGSKPFRLLRAAMSTDAWIAIAKIVMHGSEQMVALRPYRDGGILLHTLYWAHEVRALAQPQEKGGEANAAELAICGQLISALAGTFQPENFVEERSVNLRRLLDAKIAGGPVPESAAPPKKAPVMDMLAALQASLDKAKAAKAA